MRSAFETLYGKLEDRDTPGKSLVEKLVAQVESGDYQATLLSQVCNHEEDQVETLLPVWSNTGTLQVQKASGTVPVPTTPELLRFRITLLATAWQFVALRHTHCEVLKDLKPSVYQEFLQYLLGPYVSQLAAHDDKGAVLSKPPWTLVLTYEQECRRGCMKRMKANQEKMQVALKAAWNDPVIKERHFTTPLAFQASVQAANPQIFGGGAGLPPGVPIPAGGGQKRQLGGDGGKGGKGRNIKGNKGGKDTGGKTARPKCAATTPSGEAICFRYNSAKKCKSSGKKCSFAHVCGYCFQDPVHGMST
jgi:hypothetical protein